jgi:hypothetical protein
VTHALDLTSSTSISTSSVRAVAAGPLRHAAAAAAATVCGASVSSATGFIPDRRRALTGARAAGVLPVVPPASSRHGFVCQSPQIGHRAAHHDGVPILLAIKPAEALTRFAIT